MNNYEIVIIFDPALEVGLEKATDRVEKILKDNNTKIVKVDNWGKRKLAYPIKKHEHGIYVIYILELPPQNVQKIERSLNITEEVIRFLIVKPELRKIAKATAAQAERKARATANEDKAVAAQADEEE